MMIVAICAYSDQVEVEVRAQLSLLPASPKGLVITSPSSDLLLLSNPHKVCRLVRATESKNVLTFDMFR